MNPLQEYRAAVAAHDKAAARLARPDATPVDARAFFAARAAVGPAYDKAYAAAVKGDGANL